MDEINVADVVAQYIETMLWSELCNGTAPADVCDHGDRGQECDRSLQYLNYGPDDLSDQARKEIEAEVADFVTANAADLAGLTADDIGHNFLLSRNGHGCGFWDRGWGERGDRLHEATRPYGGMSAYVGDNGMVHVQG